MHPIRGMMSFNIYPSLAFIHPAKSYRFRREAFCAYRCRSNSKNTFKLSQGSAASKTVHPISLRCS